MSGFRAAVADPARGPPLEYAVWMYKPGDLVRHRTMPDWGLGRVSGEMGDGKVLIKFESRKGDVLLAADFAERLLVIDTTAVWTAATPRAVKRPATAARSKASAPRVPAMPSPFVKQAPSRTPCVNCAASLQAVVSSADGAWRSCPSCSARSGRHHVLLPFPSSFDDAANVPPPPEAPEPGTAAHEAAEEARSVYDTSDDPHFGWCRDCRAGTLATGYKTCSQVL